MGIISTKLRNSARGQECQMRLPSYCVGGTETTVLAHAPNEIRGIGSKGHDYHGAFACHACHEALDHHKLEKWAETYFWLRGLMRTQNIWVEMGLLVIPVDPATTKRRPKRKANLPTQKIPSRPFLKRTKTGRG